MDEAEQLERRLRRGSNTFAAAELFLGVVSFGLAAAIWKGVFTWQVLSEHGRWFAYGGVVLGVIFVLGGVHGLIAKRPARGLTP